MRWVLRQSLFQQPARLSRTTTAGSAWQRQRLVRQQLLWWAAEINNVFDLREQIIVGQDDRLL